MNSKKTIWLVDPEGNKAAVDTREARDRWVPLGWADADEPSGTDRVWLQHEVTEGRALFPWAVADVWAQKGWHPCDPPPPVSLFNADALPAVEPAEVAPVAPAPKAAPAPAVEKKEK